MKFKIYPWLTLDTKADPEYSDSNIYLISGIEISWSRHNFAPDENCSYRRKGTNLYILFSWLIFGFTLDFRFGTGTGINQVEA